MTRRTGRQDSRLWRGQDASAPRSTTRATLPAPRARRGDRNARLHEPRTGARADRSTSARTSGPSAVCCTSCSPDDGRLPARPASDIVAAVLEREPDLTILPARDSAGVRSLVRHCLEKDPKRRLRDIADARLAIDDVVESAGRQYAVAHVATIVNPTSSHSTPGRRRLLWMLAASSARRSSRRCLRGKAVARGSARPRLRRLSPRRVTQRHAPHWRRRSLPKSRFAVSPDGRRLALIAADDSGQARLWVRDLASAAFQPLPGTESRLVSVLVSGLPSHRIYRRGQAENDRVVAGHR